MIYEPEEDSFLFLSFLEYANGRILDMGCGSGFLSVKCKEFGADVLSVDINEEAVNHCKQLGLNAVHSDLFDNVNGKFDLILFNPPYLPNDPAEDEESKVVTTGGQSGSEVITRFLRDANRFLKDGGKILIVVSSLTKDIDFSGYHATLLKRKACFFEELRLYELKHD
ncbi:MAG: HemK2/MTQ2 family protein methyltransferase [Nanoarchaeota archaeon]